MCGEEIELEDEYYVVPGGDLICEFCIDDWVKQFHRYGEYDLDTDERS